MHHSYKAVLFIIGSDIQDTAGPLQFYAGQTSGVEAAVHSMNEKDFF